MQSRKNKSSNCVNQSSQRILSEQLAINSQIKKYKLNYHSKAVQKENIDSFIRFSRQLQLLIISYCKNIIYVAPENLSIIIEELTLLFDDLLKKYHQLFLKHHQKFSQSAVHEVKRHSLSELCAVCGQQMKKISIGKMKSYIMNEIGLKGLQKYEESDSSKQQEDLQFFQQVNNLLNIKHGELIKNQIEINNYKEMALDALSCLKAFKDNLTRETLLLPNSAWLTSAKEEMQMVLKQSFQDKIPPWISKMLTAFWNHYRQQIEKKKCEIGTQTDNNTQREILELRKKVLIGKEKLQAEQDLIKIQERQLIGLREQNINLQAKIDYYKNELTKLNEEMGNVNMENQIFKIKIRNSKLVQEIQNNEAQKDSNNDQKHQISRSYIIDSRITNQNGNKNNHQSVDQRVFPKIKRESTSKNSQQIRNSMKVDFSNKSGRSQLKKTTKKIEKISGATIGKSSKNEQMSMILNETFQSIVPNEKQQKLHKQSHQISDSSQMQKTKNYEFGELSNDDYKLRIKEVDQQMKMAVKQGTCFKNGLKHLSSASQHCTLKKVPRKMTNHQELDQSKIEINQNQLSPFQKSHYLLKQSKIYNSLKQAGYSINISEQEFKESILKIKQFNPDLSVILKPNECSQTKRSFMNVKRHQIEKQPLPRGSLYQYSSFNGHKYINNSLNHSFDQKTVNSYLPLFINIQNAYIYETKLSKSHFNSAIKLQASQHSLCQRLYELITQINKANIEHYRLICSFLRFPYQIFSNGLGSLNVGNDMKYGTFEFYFQRILSIHQKCMKQEAVCQHLRQFRKRLSEKYQSLRKDK